MADFGVQATTLSAPSGAGSAPIAPVATPKSVSIFSGLKPVADIFIKGLDENRKEEAAKRESAIVGDFIQAENLVSDGVAQGTITAAEAAARSRANFRKFSSGFPEYIESFEKAGKALRGFTEAGTSVDVVKRAEDERAADKTRAASRGFIFTDGMSKDAEDSLIRASQTGIKAEQELSALYARKAEERAQGTFDAAVSAKKEKAEGFRVINMVAGANLDAFQAFGTDISNKIRTGLMKPEEGKALITRSFSNISAALQAGARTNPELAAPYRTIFDQVFKLNMEMADPKASLDDLKNQFELAKMKLKLVAMGDPEAAAAIVTSELFANNPSINLGVASVSVKTFTKLATTPINSINADGSSVYVPQAIGNPEVEADTLKLLKSGLSDLVGGKIKNKDVASVQASNSVNHILKQTGELLDRGTTPAQLKGVASFFASPEYAGFVANNKIDKQAAGAAVKTFQRLYEPAIINGVQEKLKKIIPKGPQQFEESKEPVSFGEMVDVKFTGSGIYFEPKDKAGVSPFSKRQVGPLINELNTSQKAINQLIHIAAHMEGSTDYGKYWEKNKHIWLPSMFVAPEAQKDLGKPDAKANKAEREMAKQVVLTDQEKAADAAFERSDSNLAELRREIARTSNPAIKKVLTDYLATLGEN